MSGSQSVRNNVKELYHAYGVKIKLAYQVLLILSALLIINNTVGSVSLLKNPVISILIAVLCGVLPQALGVSVVGLIAIIHIFEISMIVALLCFIILCLVGVMSLRLAPGHNYVGIATFIISSMGGVYAAPFILAVSSTTAGLVPMVGGIVSYRLLELVGQSREILSEMTYIDGTLEFLQIVAADVQILTIIAISVITYITVAFIKDTGVEQSWKIGLFMGLAVNITLVFLINVLYETKVSIGTVVIFSLVGVAVGMVIEYFLHNVDYKSTKILKFEDDEFFYYVKAVPKKEKDPSTNVTDSKLGKKANQTNTKGRNNTREDESIDDTSRPRKKKNSDVPARKGNGKNSKANNSRNNSRTTNNKSSNRNNNTTNNNKSRTTNKPRNKK